MTKTSRIALLLVVLFALAGLITARKPAPLAVPAVETNRDPAPLPPTNFNTLAGRYRDAAPAERPALEAAGMALARQHRARLKQLIETDPRAALEEAVPYHLRKQLPAAVAALLEERVSASGPLRVIALIPDVPAATPAVLRRFEADGRSYEAFVYGRRLAQKTTAKTTAWGIAIDGKLALSEEPVRVLSPEEAIDRQPAAAQTCPISGNPASSGAALEVAGRVVYVCCSGHIAQFTEQITAQEAAAAAAAANAWTTGPKKILIIPVKFSDQAGAPDTTASLSNMMVGVNLFYITNSLQQTSITFDIAPCYTFTNTAAQYSANDTSGYAYNVLADGRAIANNPTNWGAANAGLPSYNYLNYDLEAVRYNNGPGGFSGQAYVGGRGCWLKSGGEGVADHEFGHNYGNWHANYWSATGDTIVGPGSHIEYGNQFDTMGSASGSPLFFNANFMRDLDWIGDSNLWVLGTASTSGVFRITRLDHGGTYDSATKYAIRIPSTTSQRDYWIDFRQKNNNAWLQKAAVVKWGDLPASDGGSRLLDTTPGTVDDKDDAPVVIGRTYADLTRNTFITPIGKGGTTPESLDVAVNIGTFPGNLPPTNTLTASATSVGTGVSVTFTAAASDPNGDPLAYNWDFGDRTFGSNVTVNTHSWSSTGYYVVRSTASDMKGGTAARSLLITVGSPPTFNITGIVLDATNAPVAGVRVHNGLAISDGSYRTTYTDTDGTYILPNLVAGSYTITAVKPGVTLAAASFANPVIVGPSRSGINFTGNQQLYTISGTVYDQSSQPLAGALVTDGTRSEPTSAAGTYTLYNVPLGSYQVTATKAGYSFGTNTATVSFGNLTGINFYSTTPSYYIYGQITGADTSKVVTVTDGTHTTTAYTTGNSTTLGYYLSSVPVGTWTVRAFSSTQSFSPSNFSNPVTVTNYPSSNYNFAADATQTFGISGFCTDLGTGLVNVAVTVGTASATTDARGNYYAGGLTNGSYTVTPSLAGYTFVPASRLVTLASNNSSNNNFTTTNIDPPPTIATPALATPNPTTTTTTQLSVLGADNNGEALLAYTWSTTGTPPAIVTFFPNAANAAKSALATFTKAGNYGLRAIVADTSGGTATSIVNVAVNQTLTGVTIAPSNAVLLAGGTQQFTATARDQFGTALPAQPAFTWAVSGGGTIDTNGFFSSTGALGNFTVTAITGVTTGSTTLGVTAANGPGTGITWEWFTNIGGSAVANLTSDPKFINNAPDQTSTLTNLFETPSNIADNYGSRVRGYYVAPASATNYVFWISSDDSSELWLSTDSTTNNRVKIATVPGYTGIREWTKYANQQSSNITLVAGQVYNIEALMKEGGGSDSLAVGVDVNGVQERPIPYHRLFPWNNGIVPGAPQITTQPVAQVVCPGTPATFKIAATGPGLAYQWRKNGGNLSDGATYTGSATASLQLNSATVGDTAAAGAGFDCVVTGTYAPPATSTRVALTVTSDVNIVSSSGGTTICSGGSTTFSVTATGPGLTYQWRKDTVNIGGATNASYSASLAGSYDCVVTPACGAPATSTPAILSVTPAPQVTSSPNPVTTCAGNYASFTVSASNATGFQWLKNGTNITDTGSISGSATPTLTLTNLVVGDNGAAYSCAVSGNAPCSPSVSGAAILTVASQAAITGQPSPQSTCSGNAATFTVTTTGTGVTYQWRKNTAPLSNGGTVSGASSNTLALSNVTTNDSGANFDCLVGSICGSTLTSAPAALVVSAGCWQLFDNFTTLTGWTGAGGSQGTDPAVPTNKVLQVSGGGAQTFYYKSLGTLTIPSNTMATLFFRMRRDSQPPNNWISISRAAAPSATVDQDTQIGANWTSPTGSITNMTVRDGGLTGSLATNGIFRADNWYKVWMVLNTSSNLYSVYINGGPDYPVQTGPLAEIFGAQPGSIWYTFRGSPDGATANQPGGGPPTMLQTMLTTSFANSGTNTGTAFFDDIYVDTGHVNLSDPLCTAPSITSQPTDQSACLGSPASFSVTASGDALTYQWRKAGNPVANATNAAYTINSVASGDVTNAPNGYDCVVTGACGSPQTSTRVALTLNTSTVTIAATIPNATELGLVPGQFTVWRSGCTGTAIIVSYAIGGTASNGIQYASLPGTTSLSAGMTNTTITITPLSDGIAEGNTTVLLTLQAGTGYAPGSPSNDTVTIADLPINDWRIANFGANATNASIACDLCNPSGDGIPNLLKYALNLNPNAAGTLPGGVLVNDHLTLTYVRRKAPTDVTYTIEVTGDVSGGWSNAGVTEQILADDGTFQTVRATDPATISGNVHRFIHLRVTLP